jgi:hypothetical protein
MIPHHTNTPKEKFSYHLEFVLGHNWSCGRQAGGFPHIPNWVGDLHKQE